MISSKKFPLCLRLRTKVLTLKAVYLNIRVYGNDKMEVFVRICRPEKLQNSYYNNVSFFEINLLSLLSFQNHRILIIRIMRKCFCVYKIYWTLWKCLLPYWEETTKKSATEKYWEIIKELALSVKIYISFLCVFCKIFGSVSKSWYYFLARALKPNAIATLLLVRHSRRQNLINL